MHRAQQGVSPPPPWLFENTNSINLWFHSPRFAQEGGHIPLPHSPTSLGRQGGPLACCPRPPPPPPPQIFGPDKTLIGIPVSVHAVIQGAKCINIYCIHGNFTRRKYSPTSPPALIGKNFITFFVLMIAYCYEALDHAYPQ